MSYKPDLVDRLKYHWWKIILFPLFIFKLLELQFKTRFFTLLLRFWLAAFVITPLAWGFGAWCLYVVWNLSNHTLRYHKGAVIGVSLFFFIPSAFTIIFYTFF